MDAPAPHTAEEATAPELGRAILRLSAMLVILALVLVPLLRSLPLGQTTRTGLLAWLLVGIALYWAFAGLGYRPLLILQMLAFSTAATLLTTKAALVLLGIDRLSILRRTARDLILAGGALAVVNLGSMLIGLVRRWLRKRQQDRDSGAPAAG
jgi:hypothetical protein